jgi:hypothetical protein
MRKNPAQPCEIVKLFTGYLHDYDRCVAPGCPNYGGSGHQRDYACVAQRHTDQGASGEFGVLVGGVWEPRQSVDPVDGPTYGTADFYRVGRDQQPGTVTIRSEFGISQPAVSQHLRLLREEQFVTVRREGTWRF